MKIMGKPHPKTEKKKNFLDEFVWKEDTSIILKVHTMLKQATDIQLNMETLPNKPKNPRTVQPKLLDAWLGL